MRVEYGISSHRIALHCHALPCTPMRAYVVVGVVLGMVCMEHGI